MGSFFDFLCEIDRNFATLIGRLIHAIYTIDRRAAYAG